MVSHLLVGKEKSVFAMRRAMAWGLVWTLAVLPGTCGNPHPVATPSTGASEGTTRVACTAGSTGACRIKLLVFSKTGAFRHASIPDAIAAIRILALNQHVAVDFTEDAAAFTDANLSQDAAVVFLLTTGEVLTQISRRPLSGTSTMVVDTLACTLPAIPNTTGPGMGNWLAPTLIVCMDTPKWCRRLSTSLIARIHPL